MTKAGRGFIMLDSSGTAQRYTGDVVELPRVRAVSVFHQLHCLNELRLGYCSKSDSTSMQGRGSPDHHHSSAHARHCFDYLRQALICASDTTLERLQSDSRGELPSVNGWGTLHQCRNHEEVFEWTMLHRASDDGGIL